MVRSATLKSLARALIRLDRWVTDVERNCCAGRSQRAHSPLSKTPDR
jgi:hypothetical protein